MARCAANGRASWAVIQVGFITIAANIVQVDCAITSTKMGISESYGICKGSTDIDVDSYSREPTPAGTLFLTCWFAV